MDGVGQERLCQGLDCIAHFSCGVGDLVKIDAIISTEKYRQTVNHHASPS